jgi:hypothetical protein
VVLVKKSRVFSIKNEPVPKSISSVFDELVVVVPSVFESFSLPDASAEPTCAETPIFIPSSASSRS